MPFWTKFLSFVSNEPAKPPHSPENERVHKLLVEAASCYGNNEFEKAEATFVQALQEAPSDSDVALVNYGLDCLHYHWVQSENYEKAISHFSDFVLRFPGNATVLRGRAAAYWYSGRLHEAAEDYNASLLPLPIDPGDLLGRGQVLVEMGRANEGMDDLNRCLQLLDEVPNARSNIWATLEAYARNGLGSAWSALGEFPKSLEQYELSIALRPRNAWVFFNRAQTVRKMNRLENALSDFKKALSLDEPKLPAYKRRIAEHEIEKLEGLP
jgi:tetratricopeptide (TPR) repeat protein